MGWDGMGFEEDAEVKCRQSEERRSTACCSLAACTKVLIPNTRAFKAL
jgi:hypothetical protein